MSLIREAKKQIKIAELPKSRTNQEKVKNIYSYMPHFWYNVHETKRQKKNIYI